MSLLSMAVIAEERAAFRKSSGRRDEDRGAVNSFVTLQSQSSQAPLDVNRSNCILQLTFYPSLESSLSS